MDWRRKRGLPEVPEGVSAREFLGEMKHPPFFSKMYEQDLAAFVTHSEVLDAILVLGLSQLCPLGGLSPQCHLPLPALRRLPGFMHYGNHVDDALSAITDAPQRRRHTVCNQLTKPWRKHQVLNRGWQPFLIRISVICLLYTKACALSNPVTYSWPIIRKCGYAIFTRFSISTSRQTQEKGNEFTRDIGV